MMKKRKQWNAMALAFALVFLLLTLSYAQGENPLETTTDTGGALAGSQLAGWMTGWRTLSLLAVMISLVLVAFAYAAGIAFNSREIKAWADVEIMQVFGSVLLVFAIITLLTAFDDISASFAKDAAIGVVCPSATVPGEPCAITVGKAYIDQLSGVARDKASNMLTNSIDSARQASRRVGVQANTIYAAWLGSTWAGGSPVNNVAGYTMKVDRYTTLFGQLSNVLGMLSAQKTFLETISLSLGPALLLFGIILRTFFLTRKLGGLLLATGLGLLFVFPTLYAFAWLTLVVAVHGENAFASSSEDCPQECTVRPPDTDACKQSCTYPTTGSPQITCPVACRVIPFPVDNPACVEAEAACFNCPATCKVRNTRTDCTAGAEPVCPESMCPSFCKSEHPTEDSACVACLDITYRNANSNSAKNDCPFFCRTKVIGGESYYVSHPDCKNVATCSGACMNDNCVTRVPPPADCITKCANCPEKCRVSLPKRCSNSPSTACTTDSECPGGTCNIVQDNSGWFTTVCSAVEGCADNKCPSICKVIPPQATQDPRSVNAGCADWNEHTLNDNCVHCPSICRWKPLPPDYGNPRTTYPATSNPSAPQPEQPILATQCSVFLTAYDTCVADCVNGGTPKVVCEIKCKSGDFVPGLPDFGMENLACYDPIMPDACTKEKCTDICRTVWPPVCYAYDATRTPVERCSACPVECRVDISAPGNPTTPPASTWSLVPPGIICPTDGSCSDPVKCPSTCKQVPITLPIDGTNCKTYDADSYDPVKKVMVAEAEVNAPACHACPLNCRLKSDTQSPDSKIPDDLSCNKELYSNIQKGGVPLPTSYQTCFDHQLPCRSFDCCPQNSPGFLQECDINKVYNTGPNDDCSMATYDSSEAFRTSFPLDVTGRTPAPPDAYFFMKWGATISKGAVQSCSQSVYSSPTLNWLPADNVLTNAMTPSFDSKRADLEPPGTAFMKAGIDLNKGGSGTCTSAEYGSAMAYTVSDPISLPEPVTSIPSLMKNGADLSAGSSYSCTQGVYDSAMAADGPLHYNEPVGSLPTNMKDGIEVDASGSERDCIDQAEYDAAEDSQNLPISISAPVSSIPTVMKGSENLKCIDLAVSSYKCKPLSASYACTSLVPDYKCSPLTIQTYKRRALTYRIFGTLCAKGTVCDSVGCPAACRRDPGPLSACLPYEGIPPNDKYAGACTAEEWGGGGATQDTFASCKQCPAMCRRQDSPADCATSGIFQCSGTYCPQMCKVPAIVDPPPECDSAVLRSCIGCPLACRVTYSSDSEKPPQCDIEACSPEKCAPACKPKIPVDPCEKCNECDNDCLYKDPVRTDCGDICEEKPGVTSFSVSEFLGKGATTTPEGEDPKAVGVLMIPAFVLPLFNILVTLAFIRVLSPALGGDIEIPGVSRLI